MFRDNPTTPMQAPSLSPQTLYRGMYVRVAQKLRVDPSYVSRVARGERYSKPVEDALRLEIDQINRKLGGDNVGHSHKPTRNAGPRKRLRYFVSRNNKWLRQQWLHQSQGDATLKRLPAQKRLSPIPPLMTEAVKLMKYSIKEMPGLTLKASAQHGRVRFGQGCPVGAVLEDYNLLRRCLFMLAQENQHHMDTTLLIHDLAQLGEVLDLQSQSAIKTYLAHA
jgi:hypothetical protein